MQHAHSRAGVRAALALPSLAQGSLWLAEERARSVPWFFQVLLEGSRRAGWGQNGCGGARVCGAPQGALHPCPFGEEPKQEIVPLLPGTCLASGCSFPLSTLNPFTQRLIQFLPGSFRPWGGRRKLVGWGLVCYQVTNRASHTRAPLLFLGPFWQLSALSAPCSSLELISKQS